MPFGVINGAAQEVQITAGPTVLPVASVSSAVGVVASGNGFQVTSAGTYTLQLELAARATHTALPFTIDLYNSTLGSVARDAAGNRQIKTNATAFSMGQMVDSKTFTFVLRVANVNHVFQFRVTVPNPPGSPSMVVEGDASNALFRCLLQNASAIPGGGGALTAIDTNALASPYNLTQADSGSLFYTGAGGAQTFNIPNGLATPWWCWFFDQNARITIIPQVGVGMYDGLFLIDPGPVPNQIASTAIGCLGLLTLIRPTLYSWTSQAGTWVDNGP